MKFPRNARIFRGHLDAAPFATVFFLLVMFVGLGSLVYTPGVRLQLPTADNLPGTDQPTVAVALDANGRLYFENQAIEPKALQERLSQAVKQSPEPLTLIVEWDRAATGEMLTQLEVLALNAGITNAVLATLPRPLAAHQ
ncbi:MAG TPA: biopolymer transporter ExbD [Candidatus Binatia bacterium]|jgi:biopolymer transport protein ExbD|nr:biopolymer transporter ExbD [Candidatus Binatia bacterium]